MEPRLPSKLVNPSVNVMSSRSRTCVRNGVAAMASPGMMEVGGLFFYFEAGSRRCVADHVHAPIKIDESSNDGRRAQPEGVGGLVAPAELLRPREGLQARNGRADREPEIQRAQVATFIDERVDVLLHPQQIVTPSALHDAKQIIVAAEEHVQPHLDVVPVLILPRRPLAADERAQLEDLDVVARVG